MASVSEQYMHASDMRLGSFRGTAGRSRLETQRPMSRSADFTSRLKLFTLKLKDKVVQRRDEGSKDRLEVLLFPHPVRSTVH